MDQDKLRDLRNYYDNENSVGGEDGAWETDTEDDPMVTTSIRLPKTLLDWVRAQADDQGVKPTALIRRWIEERNNADHPRPLADRVEALETAVFHTRPLTFFSDDRNPILFKWGGSRFDQVGSMRIFAHEAADRTVHDNTPADDRARTIAALLTVLKITATDAVQSEPDQADKIVNDLRAVAEEVSRTA